MIMQEKPIKYRRDLSNINAVCSRSKNENVPCINYLLPGPSAQCRKLLKLFQMIIILIRTKIRDLRIGSSLQEFSPEILRLSRLSNIGLIFKRFQQRDPRDPLDYPD